MDSDNPDEEVVKGEIDDEEYFKWAVMTALHHEEIVHHPERTSLLQHYED